MLASGVSCGLDCFSGSSCKSVFMMCVETVSPREVCCIATELVAVAENWTGACESSAGKSTSLRIECWIKISVVRSPHSICVALSSLACEGSLISRDSAQAPKLNFSSAAICESILVYLSDRCIHDHPRPHNI